MTDSIKAKKTGEIAPQKAEAKPQEAEKTEKPASSAWEDVKQYSKWFAEGVADYYSEKYKGTTGLGDALSRTGSILDEGFGMMDEYNPAEKIKKPIKKWSGKVADKLSDGNPNNLTLGERSWAAVEGIGAILDTLTSAKGLTYTCLTAGIGGGVMGAVASKSATAAAAVKVGTVAVSEVAGAGFVATGTYNIATADTEAEAKKGGTQLGTGAILLGTAAASAKDAIRTARAAGIETKSPYYMSTPEAMVENIKILPKTMASAAKEGAGAVKSAIAAYTSKSTETVIKAGSPELQNATPYMSKANDVQAYRFNPNGTPDEILANNPGVFRNAEGQYCIPNKWDPSKPYIIDSSKEQMIMLYGGDDMAVCDGAIFKGSYVDTAGFKNSKALNYQDPTSLEYGKVVNVTKQAPGAFKEVPVGTKVETLEGVATVKYGDVVAVDHAGNPYVTPMNNIVKRNIPIDTEASKAAFANLQHKIDAGFTVKPELQEKFNALIAEMQADKGPLGAASGLNDMKKIMAGLEKMNITGTMSTEGYAALATEINADLPGWYWSQAIRIYNNFAVNANVPKTMQAVQGYLSNITTVNGCSNTFRAQAALKDTTYLQVASAVTPQSIEHTPESDIDSSTETKPTGPLSGIYNKRYQF